MRLNRVYDEADVGVGDERRNAFGRLVERGGAVPGQNLQIGIRIVRPVGVRIDLHSGNFGRAAFKKPCPVIGGSQRKDRPPSSIGALEWLELSANWTAQEFDVEARPACAASGLEVVDRVVREILKRNCGDGVRYNRSPEDRARQHGHREEYSNARVHFVPHLSRSISLRVPAPCSSGCSDPGWSYPDYTRRDCPPTHSKRTRCPPPRCRNHPPS